MKQLQLHYHSSKWMRNTSIVFWPLNGNMMFLISLTWSALFLKRYWHRWLMAIEYIGSLVERKKKKSCTVMLWPHIKRRLINTVRLYGSKIEPNIIEAFQTVWRYFWAETVGWSAKMPENRAHVLSTHHFGYFWFRLDLYFFFPFPI